MTTRLCMEAFMSELGNETAMAALKVAEKTTEEIINLIKYIMTTGERKAENDYKREVMKEKQQAAVQKRISRQLDGKSGLVNAKKLMQSNDKLIPLTARFTDKDLELLEFYANKYGVVFSSISDESKTGLKDRIVIVREKDLPILKDITDRMTESSLMNKINTRIDEIVSKGDLATPEELKELASLTNQKENILRTTVKLFNDEAENEIFEDIFNKLENKSVTFERALNRFTDRDFSKDVPYYICERSNPNSYIELTSTLDNFKGSDYTKTYYNVYKDNALISQHDDGRFAGRPSDYWLNLRETMKEEGGFSDDVVIFNNIDELHKYQLLYAQMKEVNTPQINEFYDVSTSESLRDYSEVIEQLKNKRDALNVTIDDDKNFINKDDGQTIDLSNVDDSIMLSVSHAHIYQSQIDNYMKMNETQIEISLKNQAINDLKSSIAEKNEVLQTREDLAPVIVKSLNDQIESDTVKIQSIENDLVELNSGLQSLGKEENRLYYIEMQLNSIDIINTMDNEYFGDHQIALSEHDFSNFENDTFDYDLVDYEKFSYIEPEPFNNYFDVPPPMSMNEWTNKLSERKQVTPASEKDSKNILSNSKVQPSLDVER